jgi:hypothetical protein
LKLGIKARGGGREPGAWCETGRGRGGGEGGVRFKLSAFVGQLGASLVMEDDSGASNSLHEA